MEVEAAADIDVEANVDVAAAGALAAAIVAADDDEVTEVLDSVEAAVAEGTVD